MVKEAVEQLFRAATLYAQGGICTEVYDAVEHLICDQIRTTWLDKTLDKHVEKHIESGKYDEALERRLLRSDEFLQRYHLSYKRRL